MYFIIVYMDFYININMDFTYVKKYYTLVCFHLLTSLFPSFLFLFVGDNAHIIGLASIVS